MKSSIITALAVMAVSTEATVSDRRKLRVTPSTHANSIPLAVRKPSHARTPSTPVLARRPAAHGRRGRGAQIARAGKAALEARRRHHRPRRRCRRRRPGQFGGGRDRHKQEHRHDPDHGDAGRGRRRARHGPARARDGGRRSPSVNAGLNATTNVLAGGRAGAGAGTATGAPMAPTAPPGALPVTAGTAHVSGFGEGTAGSVAMLLLAGVAGAMVMA
ncbi:hypothetical protein PG997_006387 [Apiospora hydei]|uniref:Uncharacterized protein n=1 Tax=Apiospora hydei TaxID=1337664 RepID=A0ABR1WRH8_9PEZI